MLNKMGLCQSSALKITVFNTHGDKQVYYFSMKRMKTFRTFQEVFNLVDVNLDYTDKVYCNSHIGLDEMSRNETFQIKDLVIKNNKKVMKYRIVMEGMY